MRQHIRKMLREGLAYKKARVMLLDLALPQSMQTDLFHPATMGDDRLMDTVDRINRRFGRRAVGLGAAGKLKTPAWAMRQNSL